MSLRPLASMLIKVLGLYTGVQSLSALEMVWRPLSKVMIERVPLFPSYFNLLPSWADVVPGLGMGIAQAVVGVFLWRRSESIAGAMVSEEEAIAPASEANWQKIGIGILGIYLLADSASIFALVLAILIKQENWQYLSLIVPFLISASVRCIIGLWLLLGAKGIVRGVLNLKNVGRDPAMESRARGE